MVCVRREGKGLSVAREKKVVLYEAKNGGSIDDENFASFAERVVAPPQENGRRILAFENLTTSKLRGIYGLIMNIYTKINEPADFEGCRPDLQYLKARMAYEAGRDDDVKEFLNKTFLMHLVDYIKGYDQFILYCRYAESLVAYFKFYGGKE